jgi:hypothetical protein
MSQQPPTEILNSQLLATIERQRRIICDLLIKNERLRARVMHTENSADGQHERETMRRRHDSGKQTVRLGDMRMSGGSDVHRARTSH